MGKINWICHCKQYVFWLLVCLYLVYYTSAHGSGRRYYILPMKFLSFFIPPPTVVAGGIIFYC